MTALMGGSGAGTFRVVSHLGWCKKSLVVLTSFPPKLHEGKTSLLNALCGRAFYGTVEGNIQINGHKASIEEHAESVGFVPQVSKPSWLQRISALVADLVLTFDNSNGIVSKG